VDSRGSRGWRGSRGGVAGVVNTINEFQLVVLAPPPNPTPNPELRTDPINFHSSAPIVGLRTGERVCLGAVCASGKTKLGKFNEFMLVASPL